MIVWLFAAAAGVSLGLTWVLRRYALARYLVDVPNERSSHLIPTPRGGGMAIVLTFLGCLPVLWALDFLPLRSFAALSGSGGLVALIGFLDDHYHVSRRWRLLVHLVAVVWALLWLGGVPAMKVADFDLPPGWPSDAIAAVWMVWVVNLYNFMDGIDGIASIEALTLCAGGVLLYVIVLPGDPQWTTLTLLLASVAGFLYWNYPPARIFMGDAGSGFLGMAFAVLSIQAAWAKPNLFWAWTIMLGVFLVDASVTLIRRIFRGGGTYLQGHRNHAYQYAARRFGMHKPVSLAVGAINLVWLCPLAVAVGLGYLDGALGLLIAYLPLVGLAWHFKAGARES
jgi:glycosyltransferase WbpL